MVKLKEIVDEVLWEKDVFGYSGSKPPTKLKLTKEEEEQKKFITKIIDILMKDDNLKAWWNYDD